MKYRNVKTGIEIEVLSECGGDWALVEEPKKEAEAEKVGKRIQLKKLMNLANLPNLQIVPKMRKRVTSNGTLCNGTGCSRTLETNDS